MISHNRPFITKDDKAAVHAVLSSGWIAQGAEVRTLESHFVDYFGGGDACALSSGTASLYLALKLLGAGQGNAVAIPTYACSALLNAVYMAGATPQVVDVKPDDFCLDPSAIEIQAADATHVVAVHTFGAPADIEAMSNQGRKVIEDCCQSLGGHGSKGPLGIKSGVAIFSFYATKIITGGQGGLLWSRKAMLAEKARDYREFDCRQSYVQRFNFQMTDIQAALINSQLMRLNSIIERRSSIIKRYLSVLPTGFRCQSGLRSQGRMAYRCILLAPDSRRRDALRDHMATAGINCIVPIERYELLHRYLKLDPADYPVAESIVDTSLSLPLYPALKSTDVDSICQALKTFKP